MEAQYYTPAEITQNFIGIGEKKARLSALKQFVLGMMAGGFIALASQGSNQAIHTISSTGVGKTVAGALFACGLMLVVIAGGELFTGNCLMIIACAEKRISVKEMLRAWAVVYLGNFAGALLVVLLILGSGQLGFSNGMLAAFTIKTAAYKTGLSFSNAFCMGVLCNILVCAAVWMAAAAKDISGKVWAIFFPIWLFITSGFEHSIANMYYIPAGILAKANPAWAAGAAELGVSAEALAGLGLKSFLLGNLLPVTLGNIVGGAVLVGLAYGLVYLRGTKKK
jgi:formate/nitrite transporter